MVMYITFFSQLQSRYVTYSTDVVTDRNLAYADQLNGALVPLCEEAQRLLKEGIKSKYFTYYKTKSDGRKRRIDKPNEELKEYMRKVVKTFTTVGNFHFPSQMYAFVTGRRTKQLANLHKNARIVIKMDIKDFFNSCTYEFIMNSMGQVYPFCLLDWNLLEPIIQACMLNGGLPQGAPTSPILSNIAMIPFVYKANQYTQNFHRITKSQYRYGYLIEHSKEFNVIFSIYADDIIISLSGTGEFKYLSNTKKVKEHIEKLLGEETPLQLNGKKTKIVKLSKSGGVWITGLMVNKRHQVTIGHSTKQILKATIFSFLADAKNGKIWDEHKVRQMMGHVGHWRYIEPEYVDMIIQKYNQKLGMDYYATIENIIYS